MKALTILQPWASLIPAGAKTIETRSWATKYRGPLAIHAGQSKEYSLLVRHTPFYEALCQDKNSIVCYEWDNMPDSLPFGAVIAIADLIDCLKVVVRVSLKIGDEKRVAAVLENNIKVFGNELEFGDYTIGRYAWVLTNVRKINPVPAKGKQRLWEWNEKSFSLSTRRRAQYDRQLS
jgi:hypothetical protein